MGNSSRLNTTSAEAHMNLAIGCFIFIFFLLGIAVNGLFLWLLGMKMKRTVNTLWFLHLIFTYFISCSFMPFFAVYVLLDFVWVFGLFMCKLIITSFSLGTFTSVFLLTIISLDRYLFTCHPNWSQRNRTVRRAQRLIIGVWLVSLVLSTPFLAFQETLPVNGKTQCINHFAFSYEPRTKAPNFAVHLAFFIVRFLLAFLIPFIIIMACYCGVAWEMKKKGLVRRTAKPFRVLVAAVSSFFICWLPYHIYYASLLIEGVPEITLHILWVIVAIGGCFNVCFTPILYLFVGEKFQEVFKMSILGLLKKAFKDLPFAQEDDTGAEGLS
ncbi:probable G-protein coupled receptor 33 [Hemicordylus capensis]|uniref:probable G-protein coupled receptor 33 n=1 Tax=Hemicordylus capensis TaxID=884348 RepID=UPI002303AF25|nr:probable G-protein coupled receptor 33 [Hemicordylus capensis]